MRVQGAALVLVLTAVLAGCTAPPAPEPTTTPTPTAVVETAPIGEAAIPLGCADLLAVDDVAHLGAEFDNDLDLAVDENRVIVDMANLVELQRGTLRCAWSSSYGATDFHANIDLRVEPTTATELDAAQEQSYAGVFAAVDGDPSTLAVCSDGFQADETATFYNTCDVIQLRAGYRIELATSSLRSMAGQDSSVVLQLLALVDDAIDGAGPARVVEPVIGTTDPASLCVGPEIAPLLDYLGAEGQPSVAPDVTSAAVTTCRWPGEDEFGNDSGPWVSVLPGGAWALPRLREGVSSIFLQTHPSADGSFLIGVGDGVGAWRIIGDDLVSFYAYDFDATDGWEAFLESTW